MYLLGPTLTKFLATVASVMTVAAGLPSVECRCPDGRIKYFCESNLSSSSNCCCSGSDSREPNSPKGCCRGKPEEPQVAKKRACCSKAHHEWPHHTGTAPGLKSQHPCCVKTVMVLPGIQATANAGAPVQDHAAWAAVQEPGVLACVVRVPVALRPPLLPTHAPPDFVVLHCHLTC
jgi:hypothetical protein